MFIKIKVLALVLAIFAVSIAFSGEILLKKEIFITNSTIPINLLFDKYIGQTYMIRVEKSVYLSNNAVSSILRNNGLNDFSLVGSGIDIIFVDQFSSLQDLIDKTKQLYPDIILNWDAVDFPKNAKILDMDINLNSGVLDVRMSYYVYNMDSFTRMEGVFSLNSVNSNNETIARELIETLPDMYIKSIDGETVEIVYRNGGLEIHTTGRIIGYLENGYYQAQNLQSGKIIKVKLVN